MMPERDDRELLPLTSQIYDSIGLFQTMWGGPAAPPWTDPVYWDLGSFERVRRLYNQALHPVWYYVRGGRALHAFLPDMDTGHMPLVPACGIVPRCGRDQRRSLWIRRTGLPHRSVALWDSGPIKEHQGCNRELRTLLVVRRAELDRMLGEGGHDAR